MGLLEFLEWCEDLHIQPVLAVYAGYSLKQEHVNPGPDLQPYVDEALEEIEYVTGDAKTKWGARRAADGHPDPFPLTYVEIGNEDAFDHSKSYDGRFTQIHDAIKAKYPKLQLIATTKVTSRTPDLYDDHYYRSAADFEGDTHHYDNKDRHGPKIFVGEWATTEGQPTPNLNAALGDAAWMTGLERNSDLVVMASYAPLLVNVNMNPKAWQWGTNLIGYDALTSYGSPSYYAQQMFYGNVGDKVLASSRAPSATAEKSECARTEAERAHPPTPFRRYRRYEEESDLPENGKYPARRPTRPSQLDGRTRNRSRRHGDHPQRPITHGYQYPHRSEKNNTGHLTRHGSRREL
jgi:alpha-N-arabinofuranosidase